MGVKHLFDKPLKGFSKNIDLTVEGMIQETKLKVNEVGSTAGAATISGLRSASVPQEFHFNRPFAYMIVNDKTNEIVFAGIYRGPKVNNLRPTTNNDNKS